MDSAHQHRESSFLPDQKKKNVYKVNKAASNEDVSQETPGKEKEEREDDINPHLNERVDLQYEKAVETQLKGKAREAI